VLANVYGVQAAEPWQPVDPAQLALKTPVVEKDADAEAIWWEMRVEKQEERALVSHYLRIKIFNDRGRETQSTVEIPHYNKLRVRDVAGRTIKPDGQIINLNPGDVFDKEVLRARKITVNVISFALPGVEPGAIIEYRWTEEYKSADFVKLELQRDIPVQSLKLALKGKSGYFTTQKMRYYHTPDLIFRDEAKDFRSTTLTNVPAFRPEPQMPCVDCVRPWMLLYTSYGGYGISFWDAMGKRIYDETAGKIKPNDELRGAASEAIGSATTIEEKLARLYQFCQTKIRNLSDPQLSEAERAAYRENKSATDTLRSKLGSGRDVNLLFAALANAAGFNARLTVLADRDRVYFDRGMTDTYYMATLLESSNIAVEVEGKWRFFDPGTPYVSFGMLRWQEENQEAFVSDPVHSMFVRTPLSPPEKSLIKRSGKLKLSEDGTLEGDVRTEYFGHPAAANRQSDLPMTPQQREDDLKKNVKERLANAEVTNIQIENLNDPAKPLVYAYHVRVANYAQRTSKRLLFAPNYFCVGRPAMFTTSTRRYPINFAYPWSEAEELTMELPEGFELDNAEGVTPLRADNVALYEAKMSITKDQRMLIYKRNFFFGGGNHISFNVDVYQNLKTVFDAFLKNDNHQLTLKQLAIAAK
jgi:hypothetical protein